MGRGARLDRIHVKRLSQRERALFFGPALELGRSHPF